MDTRTSTFLGGLIGLMGATGIIATEIGSVGGMGLLPAPPQSEGDTFCLLTDAPFFETLEAGCYPRDLIDDLYTSPLVNRRGANIVVTMSSPPDQAAATADCGTCADYEARRDEGWFALTSRDQRREDFFERACGMLGYLRAAGPVEISHFVDQTISDRDVETMEPERMLRFATGRESSRSLSPDHASVSARETEVRREIKRLISESGAAWSIESDDQRLFLQPLVHADFNGDRIGDVLVYLRTRYEEGSAATGRVGLLTKTSAQGPVSFESLSPVEK